MERRKPPLVGMLVDVVLVTSTGWAIGLLAPLDAGPPSFGYIFLVQLAFGVGGIGLPLAHEITGGPRAASWAAVVSSVASFLILVVAITAGAAHRADAPFGEAFASNADLFLYPFFIWIVMVDGSIAWGLLRGGERDHAGE